jgi:sterol desaturase/sphingolipid hydroxylase (fatty acid hydroxylase superfamily)
MNGNEAVRWTDCRAPESALKIEQFVLALEPAIRLGIFLRIFAIVALWELAAPRRALKVSKALRRGSNITLAAINTVVLRLVFPTAAVGMAAFGVANGWGLLNHVQVQLWLAAPMAVIALDLVIWLQHVMVHAVPVL